MTITKSTYEGPYPTWEGYRVAVMVDSKHIQEYYSFAEYGSGCYQLAVEREKVLLDMQKHAAAERMANIVIDNPHKNSKSLDVVKRFKISAYCTSGKWRLAIIISNVGAKKSTRYLIRDSFNSVWERAVKQYLEWNELPVETAELINSFKPSKAALLNFIAINISSHYDKQVATEILTDVGKVITEEL